VQYTYDQLNRLVQSVSSLSGMLNLAYDGFGNLTQQGPTMLSVDPATNRINTSGYLYNANGNLVQTPDGTQYTYDVANRLVSNGVYGTMNGATYDPRNRRVFDGKYFYLYTPDGKVVNRYNPCTLGRPRRTSISPGACCPSVNPCPRGAADNRRSFAVRRSSGADRELPESAKELRKDWYKNDCDDGDDPPYGTTRGSMKPIEVRLKTYMKDYQQWKQDFQSILAGTATAAIAAEAASLAASIGEFLSSIGGSWELVFAIP
jgi:hypothetical protein